MEEFYVSLITFINYASNQFIENNKELNKKKIFFFTAFSLKNIEILNLFFLKHLQANLILKIKFLLNYILYGLYLSAIQGLSFFP